MGKEWSRQEQVHHGQWFTEEKTNFKWSTLQTSHSTRHPKGFSIYPSPWWSRTQWFQKNVQCLEKICTTGKEWRNLWINIVWTVKLVQNIMWRLNSWKRNTLQCYINQWNSLPWIWLENFTQHQAKGIDINWQLYAC